MTHSETSVFEVHARGAQSWDVLKAETVNGRVYLELDGTQLSLTRIQSEELVAWLADRMGMFE